ncbi:MAG: T9SS type A sorting domain-containing protein [Prevotellaceae bacterium]|jgi:hypothetical protein|nr:T9SS type A sorting domain-containing protein [Prevotellaceae bacterium]
MKKKSILKRTFALCAFTLLAFAGMAQSASEYCRSPFGAGNDRCYLTWTTDPGGNIIVKIISAIDGEAAGATKWRNTGLGQGLNTVTVDDSPNTGGVYFSGAVSGTNPAEFIFTPTTTITDGAIIKFNGTVEWATSLNGNAYQFDVPFTYTYGSTAQCAEPGPLPAPENPAVENGILTFDAVDNAVSYKAFVYAGSFPMYEQVVEPTGTALTYAIPGTYAVKVKAIGDNSFYLNSVESVAAEWIIDGDIPELGDSPFCHTYWHPVGGTAVGTDNDIFLTWETRADGKIYVTIDESAGNDAHFRDTGLQIGGFTLGNSEAPNGATYITVALLQGNDKVCVISPKEDVTLPLGLTIKYNANLLYQTLGSTPQNTNLWPPLNTTYTYGTNCENIVYTPLATPENVSVDENNVITFDEVDDATSYIAYIYLGTTRVFVANPIASGDALTFGFPGTFDVTVVAVPDPTNAANLIQSEESETFAWTVNYTVPQTVPQSVYCNYEIDINGDGNTAAGSDKDASYWKWETDVDGQIVVTIESAKYPTIEVTENEAPQNVDTEVAFRANGMQLSGFSIEGIPATMLLEKVGDNLGNTQTFRAKPGITLQPGLKITYSGQVEYRVLPLESPSALDDLWPTLTFATPYIYGSNCSGEATVLDKPESLAADETTLTFDGSDDAASFTVLVYNLQGELVYTQPEFTSGNAITYEVPGHYTAKVQAIGNAAAFISSEVSSESVAFDIIAPLATPTGLNINTENKLTFAAVPAALSYIVTVYQNADDETALVTLPDFVIGSVVEMGENAYGTYYVKVQAIGDDDVILNSLLSDAYTWNFQEPYVCNLFLQTEPKNHTLIKGDATHTYIDQTPNENYGKTQLTAPYFAPNWAPSENYTFDLSNDTVKIHLGDATFGDWQAQFRILPTEKIINRQGGLYDISFKVKTNKNVNVYAKWFEYSDNDFVEFTREAVDGTKTYSLEGITLNSNIFQILFDFGGNEANSDIQITDLVICGEEGEETGIATITGNTLSVYPNPASDILNIAGLAGLTEVRITDIAGKTVSIQQTSGAVNVSALNAGFYLLNVEGQTVKFVKK